MPTSQEDNTTLENVSKKKGKSPAFQFYPKDFLSDASVILMSLEARGAYINLLCVDWIENGFPAHEIGRLICFNWLSRDGSLRDAADLKDIIAQLLPCFTAHPTKPGYLTNPRLQKERESQAEHRAERQKAGEKGAKSRWNKDLANMAEPCNQNGSAIVQPMAKHGSSSSSSSSSTKDLLILDPTSSGPLPDTPAATPPVKEEKITLAPSLSMTRKQAQALIEEFGKESCEYYKRVCSDWLVANGKRKKDCAAFMRNWIRKEIAERRGFYYPKLNAGSAPPRSAAQRNQDATTEAMKEIFRETGHLNDT